MSRRWVVTAALALAFTMAGLWWAGHRGGSKTGGTYDVTSQYVKGDDLCADVHEVDVYGSKWFGPVGPDGLPAGHSYAGTLYVLNEGGTGAPTEAVGQARFTTGSTTVAFTHWRPCL